MKIRDIGLCLGLWLAAVVPAVRAEYNEIYLVSGTAIDSTTNGDAGAGFNSPAGNLVVFTSDASNLVSNDNNGRSDVFLKNVSTGSVTLVSQGLNGESAAGNSTAPRISSDGSTVVFISDAANLVNFDTNGVADVFAYSVGTGGISLVSVSTAGVQANAESSDPSVNSDGSVIAFVSSATNLDSNDLNGVDDIFVRDVGGSSTALVSMSTAAVIGDHDSSAPRISADGNLVVFVSEATNLVVNDTNAVADIFARNRTGASTTLVTPSFGGLSANMPSDQPAISSDGRYVAFSSQASNLVNDDTNGLSDIFLRDTSLNSTERISLGYNVLDPNGASTSPAVSDNGRDIVFVSSASNLIEGDTNGRADVFVYDRTTTSTARVNVNSAGFVGNKSAFAASISADAKHVFFSSDATDLTADDSNDFVDLYRIKIECLVDLGSAPTSDTDSDTTYNCDEDCGADPAKLVAGVCGCGVADSDTDADGSLDCNDGCSSDAAKTSEGTCGCGVSDGDSNGNSVADCLDPTGSTSPRKALVYVKGRRATIIFPGDFTGVRYSITLSRRGKRDISRNSTKTRLRLTLAPGRYRLRYTASLGTVTTLSSDVVSFRVK